MLTIVYTSQTSKEIYADNAFNDVAHENASFTPDDNSLTHDVSTHHHDDNAEHAISYVMEYAMHDGYDTFHACKVEANEVPLVEPTFTLACWRVEMQRWWISHEVYTALVVVHV